jgi:PAS domain S-box-containing protein
MTTPDGRLRRADADWSEFQTLLDAMPDAVLVHALDGTVVFANQQVDVLFGYAREELLGQPLEILMPERFRARHLDHRTGYAQAPRTRPMGMGLELSGLRKDGAEFPVEISLSPTELAGEPYIIAAIRDVTERKAAEAEREQLYEAAQEAVRVRNVFLSAISHDLGNPVAAIRMHSRMLREEAVGRNEPEFVEGLGQIESAAERMWKLVAELLDLARLQVGRELELNWQEMDLIAMVRVLVAAQQAETAQHQLRLEAELAELLGEWDRARLERVITNLLSNAVKYSPEGGEIVVRVAEEAETNRRGGWAVVEVRDPGVGIPEVDLPRVVERFHRGANVGQIAGNGIGLSSAKQIVEQHGGMLTITSQEGEGTTVTVRIPRGDAAEEAL